MKRRRRYAGRIADRPEATHGQIRKRISCAAQALLLPILCTLTRPAATHQKVRNFKGVQARPFGFCEV